MHEVMAPLLDVIRRDPATALLVAGGAYFVLFALMIWTLGRYNALARRLTRLWRGVDGSSLERMLHDQIDAAGDVRDQIERTAARGAANASQVRLCLQKTGLIRYDAFDGVGGQQSFSLALLDADDNGLVLSGLFSRHDMRVYAKPVEGGASSQALTAEERQAIAASRTADERRGADSDATTIAMRKR